jgi:hypothetical protein
MTTRLLDFIVIGASKSGTTSLFEYLRTHPDVFVPAGKDAPFFALDDPSTAAWPAFADEQFAQAAGELRWGTVTPRYMEHSQIPDRIHAVMPEVRLVAILRNPIDRALSQYRQQVRRGKEERSFDHAVREQMNAEHAQRIRVLDPPEVATEDTYVIRGEYNRILHGFLATFPREQLLVEFTEDLDSEPETVLQRVFAHLDVDDEFVPPNLSEHYHEGGSKERLPWLLPLARRLGPLRALWHRVPRSRRQAAWRWFFTTGNVRPEPAPEIGPNTRKALAEFWRHDVEALEALVGRQTPWRDFQDHAS